MRDQQLKVKVVGGVLTISIGVDTLCHATEYGVHRYFTQEVEITDNDVFVEELLQELISEDEDGTTLLHKAFDKAATIAIENGAEGVTLDGE